MVKLLDDLQLHRSQHGTKIVYSTGRSLHLYQELQESQKRKQRELIKPDILVCAVGTEIYHCNSKEELVLDQEWSKHLSYNWDRELVATTAANFPSLKPQPESEQRPFKVSYFVREEKAVQIALELENLLVKEAKVEIQIICSHSDHKEYNRNLDILPSSANKGMAMTFVREKLAIDVEKTVACGDSGNDIALFDNRQEKGIIVGNAQRELLDWHHNNPNPNRYLAKTNFADGIAEGLRYFSLL
jgi:sucrose-6F-phosphate phosphohydrolase